ncbi:MAG: hypothetical protein ACLVGD_04265 [Monoglobales bacterium]
MESYFKESEEEFIKYIKKYPFCTVFTRHCAFFVENGFAIVFFTIYNIREKEIAVSQT